MNVNFFLEDNSTLTEGAIAVCLICFVVIFLLCISSARKSAFKLQQQFCWAFAELSRWLQSIMKQTSKWPRRSRKVRSWASLTKKVAMPPLMTSCRSSTSGTSLQEAALDLVDANQQDPAPAILELVLLTLAVSGSKYRLKIENLEKMEIAEVVV